MVDRLSWRGSGLKTVLAVVLVVAGCLLLIWASVTIINLDQAISVDPFVKRVAIGPPIAIFFGLGFIAVGSWLLYIRRRRT